MKECMIELPGLTGRLQLLMRQDNLMFLTNACFQKVPCEVKMATPPCTGTECTNLPTVT